MSTVDSWLLLIGLLAVLTVIAVVATLRLEQRWDRDEIDELVRQRRARERSGVGTSHSVSEPGTSPGRVPFRDEGCGVGRAGGWPADVDVLLVGQQQPRPLAGRPHRT
ncbi:MAG: hypothetical protein KY469_10560 [Actinobacteria bacterium]|nr:hypothetical protein [Actinomycetota bacterium]